MFKFIVPVLLIQFSLISLSLNKLNNNINSGKLRSNAIKFYQDYLKYSEKINIELFGSSEITFFDELIRTLPGVKLIQHKEMDLQDQILDKFNSNYSCSLSGIHKNKEDYNLKKFNFFRTADYSIADIHIVDSLDVLIFLDWKHLRKNPRRLKLILFLSSSEVSRSFWRTFFRDTQIMNVILHYVNSDVVHYYKPFEKMKNGNFGVSGCLNLNSDFINIFALINTANNLNGYPAYVDFFERNMSANKLIPKVLKTNELYGKVKSSTGLVGYDPFIIYHLAKCMNFTIIRKNTVNKNDFGTNEATGAIGRIIRREVHLSGNGRFRSQHEYQDIEYSYPYYFDNICLVAPKSLKIPNWEAIYQSFTFGVWIWIFLFIFSALCLSKYFIKWHYLLGILLYNSIPRNQEKQKLFFGCCLFFALIMGTIFSGELYKSTTKPLYYPEIDSLDALEKKNLLISANSIEFNEERFSSGIIRFKTNKSNLEIAAFERNSAAVERLKDAQLLIDLYYPNLLHIVKECLGFQYMAYAVVQGFVILNTINWYLLKYLENGLIDKWEQDYIHALKLESRYHKDDLDEPDYLIFNIEDIKIALILLIIGYCVSSIIFLLEIFLNR